MLDGASLSEHPARWASNDRSDSLSQLVRKRTYGDRIGQHLILRFYRGFLLESFFSFHSAEN